MSALAAVMTKGPVCVPAPTCTSPSYWAPLMTSRPTRWLAGPLDNPKVSEDEDVGPQPRQLNDRAHTPPAVCDDHARQLPQPTPEAPKRPRPGPLAAHNPQVEVRLATARCVQCGLDWNDHLDEAAERIAKALRADMGVAQDHLQLWWAEALKWAGDRPIWKAGVALEDVALAEQALHILAQGQLPLDGGSSTKLHDQSKVTVELAARGLGPAGSMPVPPEVWDEWADPDFGGAGMRVGALPPSRCPKVALLQTVHGQGLVDLVDGAANAEVFVKWKNERKCALIVNMCMYNRRCRFKARRFKLPSLEALAVLVRTCAGASGPCHEDGLWGAKRDIANCYWSVCLPPDLAGAIQVAAGNRTYALLRVPFGWHYAPGLVQALIADLLRDLDPDGVVVVQYLDDVLFIGRDRAQVAAVAEDAAYTV